MKDISSAVDMSGVQQGWQCPVCKRVYSPSAYMCPYCGGAYNPTVICGGIGPDSPPAGDWGKTTTVRNECYDRSSELDERSSFYNAHGVTLECGFTTDS